MISCELSAMRVRRSDRARDEYAFGLKEQSDFSEGKRLPTGRDILSVLVYQRRKKRESLTDSSNIVVKKAMQIFQNANVSFMDKCNASKKLIKFHNLWVSLNKSRKRETGPHIKKISNFKTALDRYFPLHHHNWEKMMKNETDKAFLRKQMQPGEPTN